jgi:hypothetical protein
MGIHWYQYERRKGEEEEWVLESPVCVPSILDWVMRMVTMTTVTTTNPRNDLHPDVMMLVEVMVVGPVVDVVNLVPTVPLVPLLLLPEDVYGYDL